MCNSLIVRPISCLAIFSCLLVSGCNRADRASSSREGKPAGNSVAVLDDFLIGQPVQHGNLTIFPVSSKTPKLDDHYITLDEGLKNGTVEILETGSGEGPNDATDLNVQTVSDDELNPNGEAARNDAQPVDPTQDQNDVDSDEDQPAASGDAEEEPDAPTASDEQQSPITNAAPNPNGQQEDASQVPANQTLQVDNAGQQGWPTGDLDLPFPQQGGGNSVNTLMVVNRSEKPLYLMPGEIIVGGSQDRTIGQELVIQPDGKPVPVDVFCVEHGRWGLRQESQTAGALQEALASTANAGSISVAMSTDGVDVDAAAAEANKGKFVASIGQAPKSVLYAAKVSKDQSKVWENVAVANGKAGVQSDSGTFSGNYVTEEAVKRLEPYIENLETPIAKTENIVGVIVATNGKVEMIDVFESTPLFKKLWPKLLKSYALDAANVAEEENAKQVCSRNDACKFMTNALTAPEEESTVDKGIAITNRNTDEFVTISASVANPSDAAPSSRIHTSVLAH